jgi:hypothetical protein
MVNEDTLLGNVLIFTALHGVISQKTELFITTVEGTSNLVNRSKISLG